jgi:type VI protein secretion system component VasF
MSLLECCEPLFLKVCELNRMGRKGECQDYEGARRDIKKLLDDLHSRIAGDHALAKAAGPPVKDVKRQVLFPDDLQDRGAQAGGEPVTPVELALAHFVDDLVSKSKLPYAPKWQTNRLGIFYNQLSGGGQFFVLLDETIKDKSLEASERLAVFYVCLGLGFVGSLAGQAGQLKDCKEPKDCMAKIKDRISAFVDVELQNKLCPEAYKHTDERKLARKPWYDRLALAAILSFVLFMGALTAWVVMYVAATNDLATSVKVILDSEKSEKGR